MTCAAFINAFAGPETAAVLKIKLKSVKNEEVMEGGNDFYIAQLLTEHLKRPSDNIVTWDQIRDFCQLHNSKK